MRGAPQPMRSGAVSEAESCRGLLDSGRSESWVLFCIRREAIKGFEHNLMTLSQIGHCSGGVWGNQQGR